LVFNILFGFWRSDFCSSDLFAVLFNLLRRFFSLDRFYNVP
jgi:hypothetical protein